MKRLILVFCILISFHSCDGLIINEDEEEINEEDTVFTGTYLLEKHWKADDGINESHYWYKLYFSDYTGTSDTANGSILYNYKYYYYYRSNGWTFSDDWEIPFVDDDYSNWSTIVYLYEVNDQNQLRICTNTIPLGEWSEWTDYENNESTITITIDGVKRTYIQE